MASLVIVVTTLVTTAPALSHEVRPALLQLIETGAVLLEISVDQ